MNPQFTRGWCLFAIVLTFFLPLSSASTSVLPPTDSEVIVLPKYDITAERILPPIEKWQYVSIPGFEILSNASDSDTNAFVEDFYMLRQVVQIILPSFKEGTEVPTYIVLCGQGNAFETFMPDYGNRRPPTSIFAGDSERAAIVVDFTFTTQVGQFFNITHTNDPFHSFYRQYFRQLIRNNVKPATPLWLEEGLVQLFAAVEYSPKRITIGRVDGNTIMAETSGSTASSSLGTRYDPNGFSGSSYGASFGSASLNTSNAKPGSFNSLLAHHSLMPLEKFFSFDPLIARQEDWEDRFTYNAQAYLFTHLCLYGRGQKYNKAFFKLIQKAAHGPITEDIFKECFGMSYKKMEQDMRAYITFTDYTSIQRQATKGNLLTLSPKFKLREATDAESSRIAGETLRLAGHKEAALDRLIAPYVRGQYDADLLAALGLAELSNGRTARASRFLEAAVKAGTSRTRAYVELAQLRLDQIQAKTNREDQTLTGEESALVQAPLYQGLKHPPALASLYDLLARTWYLSPSTPTKEQFEELAAGARKNYTDLGLVFRVAALGAKCGQLETSRRFVEFGLANSPDQSTEAKFEQLAKELPPETKPVGKEKTAAIPSSSASR